MPIFCCTTWRFHAELQTTGTAAPLTFRGVPCPDMQHVVRHEVLHPTRFLMVLQELQHFSRFVVFPVGFL